MKHLIEITDRFVSMADAYETRKKDAAERIVSLGDERQQAKDTMNTAAANDDMAVFQEAESRVRYLTARLEAAKREQLEPFFSSKEEAVELSHEYRAAVMEAVKPLYARYKAAMDEQKTVLEELRKVQARACVGVSAFSSRAMDEAKHFMTAWTAPYVLRKHVEERYAGDAERIIDAVLNK